MTLLQWKSKRQISRTSDQPMSLRGKLGLSVFLSLFVAFGGFLLVQVGKASFEALAKGKWAVVPCQIEASAVRTVGGKSPYQPEVVYRYTYKGQVYEAVEVDRILKTADYEAAQAHVLAHPPGSQQEVYVNPANPSESTLTPGVGRALRNLVLGGVFVAIFSGIPLAIIVAVWWPRAKDKTTDPARAQRERALRGEGLSGVGVLLFGGLFTVVGAGMLVFMTILPLWRTWSAQSWVSVPCVVERSEVVRVDGDDGPTYRVDILYRYEINGQAYRSNRYSFASTGSSSGRDRKAQAVAQHPVGKQTRCFVNPSKPSQAVLKRGLTRAHWIGVFPIPFLVAGLAVLGFGWHARRVAGRQAAGALIAAGAGAGASAGAGVGANWQPAGDTQADDGLARGPVTLKPKTSRLAMLAGLVCMALFWNGIVSVFVVQLVDGYAAGKPDGCLTVFLIPFVVIGLGMIGGVLRQVLLLWAPGIAMELSRPAIPLGEDAVLRWRLVRRRWGGWGRLGRASVQIRLVGEEQATYQRGTSSVTDKHMFFQAWLVDGAETSGSMNRLSDEPAGELSVTIPADTMHSFDASNNKIVWKLETRCVTPLWPDPKETFAIEVLPRRGSVEGGE